MIPIQGRGIIEQRSGIAEDFTGLANQTSEAGLVLRARV